MHIVGPGGSISAISHSRDDTERIGAGYQAWLTTIAGHRHRDTSRPKRAALADTLFADVSEYQVPVDDSYPYQVLSIRVSTAPTKTTSLPPTTRGRAEHWTAGE
jgi:hypothetical protein